MRATGIISSGPVLGIEEVFELEVDELLEFELLEFVVFDEELLVLPLFELALDELEELDELDELEELDELDELDELEELEELLEPEWLVEFPELLLLLFDPSGIVYEELFSPPLLAGLLDFFVATTIMAITKIKIKIAAPVATAMILRRDFFSASS